MEFDVAQWRLILVSDPGDPSDHLCHHLWYIGSPTHPNPQSTFSTSPPTHLRPYLGNIKKPRLMAIEHLRRLPRASMYQYAEYGRRLETR